MGEGRGEWGYPPPPTVRKISHRYENKRTVDATQRPRYNVGIMDVPLPPSSPLSGEILPAADLENPEALAKKFTSVAIRTLAEIAQRGSSEASRVAAANALLERGHGKAAVAAIEFGEGPSKIRVEIV